MTSLDSLLAKAVNSGFRGLTEDEYRTLTAFLLAKLAGESISGSQIVRYTGSGPTAENLYPDNLEAQAIAVKSKGATYVWDPATKSWDDV